MLPVQLQPCGNPDQAEHNHILRLLTGAALDYLPGSFKRIKVLYLTMLFVPRAIWRRTVELLVDNIADRLFFFVKVGERQFYALPDILFNLVLGFIIQKLDIRGNALTLNTLTWKIW